MTGHASTEVFLRYAEKADYDLTAASKTLWLPRSSSGTCRSMLVDLAHSETREDNHDAIGRYSKDLERKAAEVLRLAFGFEGQWTDAVIVLLRAAAQIDRDPGPFSPPRHPGSLREEQGAPLMSPSVPEGADGSREDPGSTEISRGRNREASGAPEGLDRQR